MAKFYWFGGHEQFHPEVLVRHAQLAEMAGFDGVMVSEHFHPWVADVGTGGFAFATLGAMAQATETIGLMTAVTTPLFRYHPATIAQAAATIDRLSYGRFALGVGTGEPINERPLGHDFPAYSERASRMAEALQIVHRLLAGEQLDYSGQFYQTRRAKLFSPPVGSVPVYLAAGGPKSASLAAEYADGLMVSVKDVEKAKNELIEPARSKTGGRTFSVVANRWTVFGKTDTDAFQALQPWRGLRAPSRLKLFDPNELQQEADALPQGEILSNYSRVASAKDYLAAYTPLVKELGADIVGIQTTSTDIESTIQLLGSEVLPELRK